MPVITNQIVLLVFLANQKASSQIHVKTHIRECGKQDQSARESSF